MNSTPQKHIVVVLDMHRSGTSAITRSLQIIGVDIGHNFLPPNLDNKKDYWEDRDIKAMNIDLLKALGHDWHTLPPILTDELAAPIAEAFKLRAIEVLRNKLNGTGCFGLTDHRIARLLPFWQTVFDHLQARVSYIIACRNPMSVARSLAKQNGFGLEKGYYLWLEHTIASLTQTENKNRIVVNYDRLIDNPAEQLVRISRTLGLPFNPDDSEFADFRTQLLEDALRHTQYRVEDFKLDKTIPPTVSALYSTLAELAAHTLQFGDARLTSLLERISEQLRENHAASRYVEACHDKTSRLARQLAELEDQIANINQAVAERDEQIANLNQIVVERDALRAALSEVFSSRSWRITSPMRAVGRLRQTKTALHIQTAVRNTLLFLKQKGLTYSLQKSIFTFRREGLRGIRLRLSQGPLNTFSAQPSGERHSKSDSFTNVSLLWDPGRNAYALGPSPEGYTYISPRQPDNLDEVIAAMRVRPRFSIIVPTYNTPTELLQKAMDSVVSQWYPCWELILVDDASTSEETNRFLAKISDPHILALRLSENKGISRATNAGIEKASGDFVVFLDHDDELTEDCLFELACCIERDNPDYIYSDEDKISPMGRFVQPHFKPDWSPDTMMSTMYTCHVSCIRRSLLEEIGGLRSEYDGCQDWDLVLRLTEKTDRISHIPKVLYHWRIFTGSIAMDIAAKSYVLEASKKVRLNALNRRGFSGEVEPIEQVPGYFRVRYHIQGSPLISIIIPTRDNCKVLERCLDSILRNSSYANYEIIVIDNGSVESDIINYLKDIQYREPRIKVTRHNVPFNFSELNNIGVHVASGEILLFLNDDTEVISSDWLERMAGYAQLPHVGAVGAKLLYPGGQEVQHAGILNLADGPGHAFLRQAADNPGYYMRNLLEYNWFAVTGACLMVSRKKFLSVGAFNETLPIAYNDVELCIRLLDAGLYNVVCQSATLIHHESASRGLDHLDPQKLARLKQERRRLYELHPKYFQYDPFHNPNLHPNGVQFDLVS